MNRPTSGNAGSTPRNLRPQPPQEPFALEYGTRQRRQPTTVLPVVAGICAATLLAMFTGGMLVAVPSFGRILKDFKVELPLITRICLGISNAMRTPPYGVVIIALMWTLPLLAAVLVAAVNSRRPEQPFFKARSIRVITVLLFMLMVLFFGLSLFLPMVTLVGAVSGMK